MHKKVIKFLSFFILNKQKRKEFRKKFSHLNLEFAIGKKRYDVVGNNNRIIVIIDGKEYLLPRFLVIKGLSVKITGNDNTVKIEFPIFCMQNNRFAILGDNNFISLKKSRFYIKNFSIGSHKGNNRSVLIDENFSVERLYLLIEDSDSSVVIGKDCMFSHDLFFRHSDGHCIVDKNGNICNRATKMIIGDHVWIGAYVTLLKNVCIPDGCIVGSQSVISKKFSQKNSVIAGNPAKVVKENICWIRESVNEYSERMMNE